jgi:tetratricopeptide (TPR) repeat protein
VLCAHNHYLCELARIYFSGGINKYTSALATYLDDSRASDTFNVLISAKVLLDMLGYTWSVLDKYEKKYTLGSVKNSQGDIYYEVEKYDKALDYYTKAIEDNPDASYYYNQGMALYNLRRFNESLSSFDRAIQVGSDKAYYYNGRGVALFSLYRYREASQAFSEALRLDPSNTTYQENVKNAISRI